eukprot:367493-Amphidinium_carterae.1
MGVSTRTSSSRPCVWCGMLMHCSSPRLPSHGATVLRRNAKLCLYSPKCARPAASAQNFPRKPQKHTTVPT